MITAKSALRGTTLGLTSHLHHVWHGTTRAVSRGPWRRYSTSEKLKLDTPHLPDRLTTIESDLAHYYPTMTKLQQQDHYNCISIEKFWQMIDKLDPTTLQQKILDSDVKEIYNINGRVKNIRSSGKKIWFIDLEENDQTLQIITRFNHLYPNLNKDQVTNLFDNLKFIRKNDYIQCSGHIGKSQSQTGMISLIATKLPIMLSPNQILLPNKLSDTAKINYNRVTNYQINGVGILKFRFELIKLIRQFYQDELNFIEVETPILNHRANGAIAGKFNTINKKNQNLQLRIAPEIWLKQLIISGMDRIFEIGKVFRNENVDSTHNCEFTILESYQRYISLNDLISMAEKLFKFILLNYNNLVANANFQPRESVLQMVNDMKQQLTKNDWKFTKIEFMPALSEELKINLNEIDWNDKSNWINIILQMDKPILTEKELHSMRIDQIINKLSETLLEKKYCNVNYPTLLLYQPSVISPLAKNRDTDVDSNDKNILTNRFEMFIKGNEYINAYEEENCPNLQYDKFKLQQSNQERIDKTKIINDSANSFDTDNLNIDIGYINNMKSGMPPTGGFGLGIDRLVMLLSGVDRIEHVLPFGTIDDITRQ